MTRTQLQLVRASDVPEREPDPVPPSTRTAAGASLLAACRLAQVAAWRFDCTSGLVYWSNATPRPNDVIGACGVPMDGALQFILDADRQSVRAALLTCERSGTPFELRVEVGEAQSGYRPVRVLGEAVRDEHGRITSLQGAVQTMAEQARVEAELAQTAARLTATFESITDALFTLDRDWRFEYVNREAERILCHHRTELAGRSVWETFPDVIPAARGHEVRTALLAGETVALEFYTDKLDCWFDLKVYPSAEGFAVYFRDTSARKRADDQLRLQAKVLDEARDMILVRDLDLRIELWNRSAERLLGWSAGEVIGRNMNDLLHIEPNALREAIATTLATGGWEGTIEKRHRDGHVLTFESRWTMLRDDDGLPRAFLSIETDVSERRGLEQQILRAQRLESLGTLAGGIAHDLNNVLSPIMLSIDMLKARANDDESREILELIGEAAERGADMVGQVLSFARGADGRRLTVPTHSLIADVAEIACKTFPKDVEIEIAVPPDCWPLRGDATQLHQVLLNLCVNARDAMPSGGRLTISAENVMLDSHYAAMNVEAKAGPHVHLEVCDTGTGIPPELLEKIFEPFFTTKAQGEGTGLGLATCCGIVRGHAGFIRVHSAMGAGTRMSIHLPASVEDDAPAAEEPAHDEPRRGVGEMVLVIDDEAAIREVTRRTLEAFGYRVLVAADGPEALAIYAERAADIDVVLTDMMMPVMDGIATTRVLRRMNPQVVVIAASGIAVAGKAAEAFEAGIREFLPKPYTSAVLLHAIERALDR